MRLVVTGSRFGFVGLEQWLDRWVKKYGAPELVILGDARGVDAQAREWAIKHGYTYIVHVADWQTHGKSAGPVRNQKMIDMANIGDWCVAFPKGESKGTYDCIRRAKQRGLFTFIPQEMSDE